jgi:phospholipid/cholesterol/gamma-HCH transport system ATP-binding protein
VSDPVIKVTDLTMGWDGLVLQQDASFEIERGSVFAILGGSGCGKSTMLRHLIGLEPLLSGTVTINGLKPDSDLAVPARPLFGVMFQSGALLGSLTVGENVALPLQEWTELPADAIGGIVAAKLRLVGLSGALDRMPAELSGGMRKRVGLARAIAMDAEIILYDEPTTGLDPITADAINDLIIDLRKKLGVTSVAITHDMHSAYKISDRIAMLYKGEIQEIGTPDEIRNTTNPIVKQFISGSAVGPITAD